MSISKRSAFHQKCAQVFANELLLLSKHVHYASCPNRPWSGLTRWM